MPRRSRRQRQQINTETIQELQKDFSARFQSRKQKKGLCLKDVVALMQDQLQDALRKNWSYQDCCELLAEKKIYISPSTLQQYLRDLNQDASSTSKPKQVQQPRNHQDSYKEDKEDEYDDIFVQPSVEAEISETESTGAAKRFNTLDRRNI